MKLQPLCNRAADGTWQMPEDGWVMLAPKGEFPHGESGKVQVIDEKALEAMANSLPEGGALVDFDHFSYSTDKSSQAAGWIQKLQARPTGLFGQVKWSRAGQEAIKNGEFRFISPVWLKRDCEVLDAKRVRPLKLDTAGMTNAPNLKGIAPLANRGGQTNDEFPATTPGVSKPQTQEDRMNNLMLALGLVAAASEADALAAVQVLKNRAIEAEKKLGEKDTELAKANETLKNRTAELEGLREAQIEADLETHGRGLPEAKREALRAALKNDRKGTLELLGLFPVAKPGSPAQPMHNRSGAKTPTTTAAGEQNPEARAAAQRGEVEAYKNSHHCSFEAAWEAVQRAKPELFAN